MYLTILNLLTILFFKIPQILLSATMRYTGVCHVRRGAFFVSYRPIPLARKSFFVYSFNLRVRIKQYYMLLSRGTCLSYKYITRDVQCNYYNNRAQSKCIIFIYLQTRRRLFFTCANTARCRRPSVPIIKIIIINLAHLPSGDDIYLI